MKEAGAPDGGEAAALARLRVVRTQLGTGPLLLPIVVSRDEENFLIELDGLPGARNLGDQQQQGIRLVPARQIVEVFVLVEGCDAGRHVRLVVTEEDDDAIARLAHQPRPPFVIDGVGLALPGRGRLCCAQPQRQYETEIYEPRTTWEKPWPDLHFLLLNLVLCRGFGHHF